MLVLGAGGGAAVLQALGAAARSVDAVELQPHVVEMVRDRFREFSGGVYENPAVRVHVADPRSFVEASGDEYDLVQVIALGSSTAGLHALEAERLLTVESVRAVLARLSAGGGGRVHRPDPPSSARRAPPASYGARRAGGRDARASRRTHRVDQELEHRHPRGRPGAAVGRTGRVGAGVRGRACVRSRPRPRHGARRSEPFNVLDRSYFHEAAQRLLDERRDELVRDYKFDIRPATDDRPYFRSFFRWAHAREILRLSRQGGIGLLDVGYLALPAALVQAVVASAALILLPLLAVRRSAVARTGGRRSPASSASASPSC